MSSTTAPSPEVLDAFGVNAAAQRLTGGQGTSWRAGEIVLKPQDEALQRWLGEQLTTIERRGFRLADPVCARDGRWTFDGWGATHFVPGAPADPPRWPELMAAARAFHRAIAHLPRPALLDDVRNWWMTADRMAWDEEDVHVGPELAPIVRRLRAACRPLGEPQCVHADLTGNVLFAPALSPAIIDVAPYWRPVQYAEGVVVADSLCWYDASAELPTQLDVPITAVARALLFRALTTQQRVDAGVGVDDLADDVRRYVHAADLIGV